MSQFILSVVENSGAILQLTATITSHK